MKFINLFFIALLFSFSAFGQQKIDDLTSKKITVNGKIEVNSTTQASKPCPPMTQTQRDAIVSPAEAGCIWNTTSKAINAWNGTSWGSIGGGLSSWVTSFSYAIGDVVIQSNKIYRALIAHTSGTFATDLANGDWVELSKGVTSTGTIADNRVARFDGATGELIQSSGITLDDSNNLSGANNISLLGDLTLKTSFTGPLKATAGVVSASAIDLSTEVVGTLPITNGGTGSTSKSWVDLTTNQSGIAGNKAFVSNLSTSGTMLASNLSGTNTGDLITQGVTGLNSAVTNILEFPLNQVTTTATGTRKVDTGNGNVLANSSFESSTVGLGWQATNVTLANSTTNVQDGVKSIQITSTTSNWSFDYQSSLYPSAKAGQSAEGSLWVQSTGTGSNDIWLCEGSYTATPVLGPCDKYDGSGLPRQLKIYTPFKPTGSGIRLMGNTSGTVIHADSAKFDNRDFSYSNYNFTDWVSYTPIWTASTTNPSIGNGTLQGKWRRVGDSMEIRTYLHYGSTSTKGSGFYLLSIPPGYAVDLSKLPNSSSLANIGDGQYISQLSVTGSQVQSAFLESTTTFKMLTDQNAASNLFSSAQSNVFTSTNDNWATSIKVPIVGWDSNNAAVASESVQVSSDTIPFVFKSTAIVDADPVGTYNTYTIAASGNLPVLATSAPTQTSASMNADGFRVFARPFGSNGTAASPARVDIKIGKDLKSNKVLAYVNTGKNLPISFDFYQANATTLSGARVVYNATTGILTIDAAMDQLGGSSTRYIGMDVISPANPTSGYFTFSASRYADIASIPMINPYAVRAFGSSTNIAASGATTKIIFGNIGWDATGRYNTSTGEYTCLVSGKYEGAVNFQAASASGTGAAGNVSILKMLKTGAVNQTVNMGSFMAQVVTPALTRFLHGKGEVNCLAGEKITFQIFNQDSLFNGANSDSATWMTIRKIAD